MKTLAVVSAINDASMIVTALLPLLQTAMVNQAEEVDDGDIAAALGRLDARVQELRANILANALAVAQAKRDVGSVGGED